MRRLVTLLALSLVATVSTVAAAESYYWHEGSANPPKASHVYRYTTSQSCGYLHQYQTSALSAGADTVMHLTVGNAEVAWNDNGGPGLGSQITYMCSGSGFQDVTIWVRAADNESGGRPELNFTYTFKHSIIINGQTVTGFTDTSVPLGGFLLGGAGGLNTASTDTMETIFVNDGAAATILMSLSRDTPGMGHYKLRSWNQSSGVGPASRLSGNGSQTDELWVIATPTEATREGPVRVARNDKATSDADGDGLGNQLEYEACTCTGAGSGSYSCPWSTTFSCSGVTNKKDTDGDGISDLYELIGKQVFHPFTGLEVYSLSLPLWGAKPRHKDVFVELDWVATRPDGTTLPPFPVQQANLAAGPYANLAIPNIDGIPGVSLHIDVGANGGCNDEPGDVDGISRMCGNFGGATTLSSEPVFTNSCESMLSANMSTHRRGVFHWMYRCGNGCRGSTKADHRCSQISGSLVDQNNQLTNDPSELVIHELGHQIGLEHWGRNEAGLANRKPHYPSIMNYTYQAGTLPAGVPGGGLASRKFSSGTLPSINPRNLSETTEWAPGENLGFMTTWKYDFDTDGTTNKIDWNRDGLYSPSVRANVIAQPGERMNGQHLPTQTDVTDLAPIDTAAGAGAAYVNPYTYVVVSTDGLLMWSRRTTGSWTAWAVVPSAPSARVDSSPSVLTVGSEFYVFFVNDSGSSVRYARFSASGVLQGTGWQTISPPNNVVLREVNATLVDGNIYLSTVSVTGSTSLARVWIGVFAGTTWDRWHLAQSGGTDLLSGTNQFQVTPALVQGPDGLVRLFVREEGMQRNGELLMYEALSLPGTFTPTTAVWTAPSCKLAGRITALYRPHRTATGTPLSSGNGALWIWYNVENCSAEPYRARYRRTNGILDAAGPGAGFSMGFWYESLLGTGHDRGPTCLDLDLGANGDAQERAGGAAAVDHPTSIALFMSHSGDETCSDGVMYVPYGDGEGMPSVAASDFDDVTFIEDNLCGSVHAGASCEICVSSGTCAPAPIGGEDIDCTYELE